LDLGEWELMSLAHYALIVGTTGTVTILSA
jgi:hypothetical protein